MNQELKVSGTSVLLLRVLLSGIFINAGLVHVLQPEQTVSRLLAAPNGHLVLWFGDPLYLGLMSGYGLLLAGIALLLGIRSRWASAILLLLLLPITITVQTGHGWLYGPLWKNIALSGGLIFFIRNNPKVYSIHF